MSDRACSAACGDHGGQAVHQQRPGDHHPQAEGLVAPQEGGSQYAFLKIKLKIKIRNKKNIVFKNISKYAFPLNSVASKIFTVIARQSLNKEEGEILHGIH